MYTLFQPCFIHAIDYKSFEVLPKHNEYGFISESFSALTNNKLLLPV